MKTDIWGTDGAHVGTFAFDDIGGKDMAVFQVSITVCGTKNFDFWWHYVLGQYHKALEQIEEAHPTQTDKGDE